MQDNKEPDKKDQENQGSDPDREVDEALRKFQLQTGLGDGSGILSFMRLALKASAPAGQPGRSRRPAAPRPSYRQPERPAPEHYEPITPTSSSWVLVMIAAALIGVLISWLARTGALN